MNLVSKILEKLFHWDKIFLSELSSDQKIEIDVKLHPILLRFPKPLEKYYLNYFQSNSKLQIKISAIVGALFFLVFFPFDMYFIPEFSTKFLIVRFLTSVFIVSIAFYASNLKNSTHTQLLLSVATILVGTVDISFIVIASPKLNDSYYVGLILIYFWSYVYLKQRYLWSMISGFSIFFIYLFFSKFVIDLDQHISFISIFYLLASNIAGVGISYSLEYYSRREYFQQLMIKNSIDLNFDLNEKISESKKVIFQAQEKLMLQSKAIESAANCIVIVNRKGNIIFCNSAVSQSTGYSRDELLGKNPRIFKSGKHDILFYKNIWNTVLNRNVWSGEIINKKKNGELIYEEMIITPVTENGSNIISHFIAIKQDISSRKEMEKNLLESESRFRSLFENATLGLYRTSESGNVLMVNNALFKMLGYNSSEEMQNSNLNSNGYVIPQRRTEFIDQVKKHGSIAGFESEWRKKDGSIIYISESARKDFDESGNLIFEGTVEDITNRKMAEFELQHSQEFLQMIFDNVYNAIFIHDEHGNILTVNNKVLSLYNISFSDAIKLNIADYADENNSFENAKKMWEKVINGETFLTELKAKRPLENYVFDVEVFLSRIFLNQKNYILANVRDITAQKEAHKNLYITQKSVEMSGAPIFWISKNADIIYVNNAAVQMLGYSFDELTKMRIPDIDPNWTQNYWDNVGFPRLAKHRVDHFETSQITKFGDKIPIEVNSTIINYGNEEIIVSIITNLTERKKAADELIIAKERAEMSNKLKSEFLAGMSHEIRTPVNTILNFISLIKSDLGENVNGDIKSSFEMIDSGSRRLIRTIDSIINMSQFQAGSYDMKLEKVSVSDLIKPIYNEFKHFANQKNLRFELTQDSEDFFIIADSYTLTQLFINLFDNSIKYTKSGKIQISISSDDDYAIVEISDTGIGISEEFLPTLFEPFRQEEMGYTRSFEGNGLGLALVKKYLELNNGLISVKSQKGIGSTFTVKLKKESTVYHI